MNSGTLWSSLSPATKVRLGEHIVQNRGEPVQPTLLMRCVRRENGPRWMVGRGRA